MIASLVGDPARANMLTALMTGRALTASELATEAGVTPQTATAHLTKLVDGGLTTARKQGRHRYFALSGPDVAEVLENLMGLAERVGHARVRTGPSDPAMRHARICYDHLAGEMGVALFDSLTARGFLAEQGENLSLTPDGEAFFSDWGVDLTTADAGRRPLCRACLDWSARRTHLAGALGAATLTRMTDLGWARRVEGSRIVAFSQRGETAFAATFSAA